MSVRPASNPGARTTGELVGPELIAGGPTAEVLAAEVLVIGELGLGETVADVRVHDASRRSTASRTARPRIPAS